MSSYDLSAWPLFRSVIDDGDPAAQEKARRCFLIAPAAKTDADARRRSDAVWKYIIRPAMLDGAYQVTRGEEGRSGTPQTVIDALLDSDLVIALASGPYSNVYYEIAVAQAAGRPVILLVEEGQSPAIDPRGAAVVTYSLDTDAVFSGANVRRLQDAIAQLEETPAQQPFRPGANPLAGSGAHGATLFERSRMFRYDSRLDMIRKAERRIDIMGVANLAIALHPDTLDAVRDHASGGLELRVLQCSPTNPGLLSLFGSREADHLAAVKNEIDSAAEAWKRIVDQAGANVAVSVRRQQQIVPLASALITDRSVVSTPYMASLPTSESPTLHAAAGSVFHSVMMTEFDRLWSDAAPLFRSDRRPAQQAAARPVVEAPHATFSPNPAVEAIRPQAANQTSPSGGGVLRGLASIRGPGPHNY